jgi:D-glycero-D-manno-heptose 1,7-bisphosphate phosphatase
VRSEGAPLRPAVFLDRDGTLIQEAEYLSDPADVELISGAIEGLARLREAGFVLVLVTNQSGIARGRFSVTQYEAVAHRLDSLLAREDLSLDGTYYCPHHPEFTGDCLCRKPAAGMFREASQDLGLDPTQSVFVGDRVRDLLPALELGGEGVLVRTGYGKTEEENLPDVFHVADDLLQAAEMILGGL